MKRLLFITFSILSIPVFSQVNLPDGVHVLNGKPVDDRTHYSTRVAAWAGVTSGRRVPGLTVFIDSANAEYWWKYGDLTNAGLVLKSAAAGAPGSDKQIIFNNSGSFGASSQFTYDVANNRTLIGSGNTNNQGTDNFVWGLNSAINKGSWSWVFGEENTINLTSGTAGFGDNAIMSGYQNQINNTSSNPFVGTFETAIGGGYDNVSNDATQGWMSGGNHNRLTLCRSCVTLGGEWGEASGYGAFAHGLQDQAGHAITPAPTQRVLASGKNAFNFSINNNWQTVGRGATAERSTILNTKNGNVACIGCASIGGYGLNVSSSYDSGTVAVSHLAIMRAPNILDTAGFVLAYRSSDGKVVRRHVSSISGGGGGGTVATFSEALAGTNDTHFMSPLKNNYVNARVYNVEAYGAVHDGVVIFNSLNGGSGVTGSSGSPLLSNGDGLFTSAMVGKSITISGAGSGGATLHTTVLSITSSTQITLATNLLSNLTSSIAVIGTDDTSAIQAAINACHSGGGGNVYFPNGVYIIGGSLVTSANGGNPNCQIYMPALASSLISTKEVSINLVGESLTNRSTFAGGVCLYSVLTTITGHNPSVIGTIGDATNTNNLSYSDIKLKNINVRIWTNAGAHAPFLSGINFFKAAQASLDHVTATIDVPLHSIVDPTGSHTFGIAGGQVNNYGPNVWEEVEAVGFEYGAIPAEHTNIIAAVFVGNVNGIVILRGGHAVTGGLVALQTNHRHILFPDSTQFLGQHNDLGEGAPIDFIAECEYNQDGYWTDVVELLKDLNNNAAGTLNLQAADVAAADNLYNSMVFSSISTFRLNVRRFTSLLDKRTNMAGGPITVTYGAGNPAFGQNNAVFEVNSGHAGTSTDNSGTMQIVTNQSNTSSAPIGIFQMLNSNISATDKRMYSLITQTAGAINTSNIFEYVMNAGTLQNIRTVTPSLYNIPIAVKLDNLSGTGKRVVIADASGNLSASKQISGSFSTTGSATTTFTVTFGNTQDNTSYKVLVTPTDALAAALFYVTNKTTTTFDVTYLSGLTGTVSFDWLVQP